MYEIFIPFILENLKKSSTFKKTNGLFLLIYSIISTVSIWIQMQIYEINCYGLIQCLIAKYIKLTEIKTQLAQLHFV